MAKKQGAAIVEQVIEVGQEIPSDKSESTSGEMLLSSGSTLWNLASTGSPKGGFATGKFYNVVGDSASGKTAGVLGVAAEAANDVRFDDYDIVLDEPERSCEFDIARMYGQKLADRIKPPRRDKEGNPIHSVTVQDFHDNLTDYFDKKRPVFYILDSFDSLTTQDELDHEADDKEARRDGKDGKGTYAMDKAKYASKLFRLINAQIKDTKSILIVISQVRENIDPMSFKKFTRAGGKALDFYAAGIMWTAVTKKLHKTVHDQKYVIGSQVKLEVTKNKHNGRLRTIEFPIFYDYGIDDISSCIDYLGSSGAWNIEKGRVYNMGSLSDLLPEKKPGSKTEPALTMSECIAAIEQGNYQKDLRCEVVRTWNDIEERLKLNRKPKYV